MNMEAIKSFPDNEEFSFLRGLEIKSYRIRLPLNVFARVYNTHQHSEMCLSVHGRQDK